MSRIFWGATGRKKVAACDLASGDARIKLKPTSGEPASGARNDEADGVSFSHHSFFFQKKLAAHVRTRIAER